MKSKKERPEVAAETKSIDYEVEWQLSETEIEELKKQHLENLDKIDELLVKKKQITDELKTQIKQLNLDNYKLRAKIKVGKELRIAQCECQFNYNTDTKIIYHPQTHEVIKELPLTDEDKQMEFEQ